MAKTGKPKKSRRQLKLGLFGRLLLVTLVAALGIQVYRLRDQVERAEAEKVLLSEQVHSRQQANEQLQKAIDDGGTQEQMERIARDELGLVAPGDRVFYDVSN